MPIIIGGREQFWWEEAKANLEFDYLFEFSFLYLIKIEKILTII